MTDFARRLPGWLIVPFMLGSAIGAMIGIFTVAAENVPSFLLAVGIAAILAGVLQVVIVCMWELVVLPEARSWIRALAFIFGLGASGVSGLFGGGTFTLIWNRNALASYATEQNAKTITDPVSAFSTRMLNLATAFKQISSDSAKKQILEAKGGTCVDERPAIGFKQRYRLRKRQAEESDKLATLAGKLSEQATVILQTLKNNETAEGMEQALRAARSIESGADFASTKLWLEGEVDGFDSEFFDADTRTRFSCSDPQLEKKMQAALALIGPDKATGKSAFELPVVPPLPAHIDLKDTIERSFADASALGWMLISNKIDSSRYAEFSYVVPGYVLAFAIEIILIVLILMDAAIRRPEGHFWTPSDVFNLKRRKLPTELRDRYRFYVEKILGLLYEDHNHVYFARPLDGNHWIAALCLEASINLQLPKDRDLRPDVPLADIDPEWVHARHGVHGGARRFAMHPLRSEHIEWMRLAAADLMDFTSPAASSEQQPDASKSSSGADVQETETRRSPVLKIRADANGNFYAPAEINALPIRTMIDTGASCIALSYSDAERLNLKPGGLNFNVTVATANGTALKARVVLESVRLATIEVKNVDALVSLPGALSTSLLGMSFLQRTIFAVNGPEMTLFE